MITSVQVGTLLLEGLMTIAVDSAEDLYGNTEGILGLTPKAHGDSQLVVQQLYRKGYIDQEMFSTNYKQDSERSYIDIGGYSSEFASSDDDIAWVELYDNDHWNVPIH